MIFQVHGVVGLDGDSDLGAVGAEQNRGRGQDSGGLERVPPKSTSGVVPRKQGAVRVRHVDLDEHRAAGGIEHLRDARDGAAKTPTRKMRHRHRRRLAGVHRVDADLRDVDVCPKGADLRDPVEQVLPVLTRAPT